MVIGGLQFVLDNFLYGLFVTELGFPLIGNVASRLMAALVGYLLNASLTFKKEQEGQLHRKFFRYVCLWVVMTAISTGGLAIAGVVIGGNKHSFSYVLTKIILELFLSALSFLAMKFWVFRAKNSPEQLIG